MLSPTISELVRCTSDCTVCSGPIMPKLVLENRKHEDIYITQMVILCLSSLIYYIYVNFTYRSMVDAQGISAICISPRFGSSPGVGLGTGGSRDFLTSPITHQPINTQWRQTRICGGLISVSCLLCSSCAWANLKCCDSDSLRRPPKKRQ